MNFNVQLVVVFGFMLAVANCASHIMFDTVSIRYVLFAVFPVFKCNDELRMSVSIFLFPSFSLIILTSEE